MPPKKEKKPKDLNAPKRPPSAYILFNKERQRELREANPDKKLTEITKMIGEEWKGLDASQKTRFETEANSLKETYKTEFAAYQKTDMCAAFQEKVKAWKRKQQNGAAADNGNSDSDDEADSDAPPPPGTKPKDQNAPKKPLTAFFLFQTKRRSSLKEENPTAKITEITKMAGNEWKEMDEDAKQTYAEEAKQLKEAYDERIKQYKETDEYKEYQARVKEWQQKKKAHDSYQKGGKKKVKAAKKATKATKVKAPEPDSESSDSGSDDSGSSSGSGSGSGSGSSESASDCSDSE